jgi:hypothetical protein
LPSGQSRRSRQVQYGAAHGAFASEQSSPLLHRANIGCSQVTERDGLGLTKATLLA